MRDDDAAGWFGSISGSLDFTKTAVDTSQEGTELYTDAQRALVGQERDDYVGDTSARLGGVVKRGYLMASLYGLGGVSREWGDYADFRTQNDGKYDLYNADAAGLKPYFGVGIDGSLGSVESLTIGFTYEYILASTQTQSYISSSSTNTNPDPYGDPTYVYTVVTRPGGQRTTSPAGALQLYGEIGGIRAYLLFRGQDAAAGVLYHF